MPLLSCSSAPGRGELVWHSFRAPSGHTASRCSAALKQEKAVPRRGKGVRKGLISGAAAQARSESKRRVRASAIERERSVLCECDSRLQAGKGVGRREALLLVRSHCFCATPHVLLGIAACLCIRLLQGTPYIHPSQTALFLQGEHGGCRSRHFVCSLCYRLQGRLPRSTGCHAIVRVVHVAAGPRWYLQIWACCRLR